MKKKILCGMIAAAMLLGACPATALAADDAVTLKKPLDFRNMKEDYVDEEIGYTWKASSQKLILENFRVVVPHGIMEEEAVIYLPDESKIEIEGKNNYIKTESYYCDVFYCEGELLISNDGKIEISTDSMGSDVIFAKKGPVIIDDEVEMTIEPLKGKIFRVENVKGEGPIISIQDEAIIKVLAEEMDKNSIFITYKRGATPTNKWVDLAEKADEWDDEYINLVSKAAAKIEAPEEETPATPPETETPSEEPAKQSEYQITIGNAAIKKDGYVTYISDAKPYLSHGYTMLPLRALLNVTGGDVAIKWDAATKTVTVSKEDKVVSVVIGEKEILSSNSENFSAYTPAELNSGRAFVSLRDWMNILSALGMPASDLNWDSKTQTVTFVK